MYLDDIIDHVRAYFAGNSRAVSALKIKTVNTVPIRIDHAMACFAARSVTAVEVTSTGKGYDRSYVVLEYPNGEVETFEVGCLLSKQGIRKSVDGICERFLAAA